MLKFRENFIKVGEFFKQNLQKMCNNFEIKLKKCENVLRNLAEFLNLERCKSL